MGRIPVAYALQLAKWELVNLYLEDNEFSADFSRLRQVHKSVLSRLIKTPFGPEADSKTTSEEYLDKLIELLGKAAPDIGGALRFTDKIDEILQVTADIDFETTLLSHFPPDRVKGLEELVRELRSLANQFGLDYAWSVPLLLIAAVGDPVSETTIDRKTTSATSFSDEERDLIRDLLAMEVYRLSAKSTENLEPLRIEIPAAMVLWIPTNTILNIVRTFVQSYKENMGNSGIPQDTQSGLHKQIRWVFAKKRYNLSYKGIMDSEYYGDKYAGYSQIANAIRKWDKAFRS